MRNIENIYTDYGELMGKVSEEVVENRLKQLYMEMDTFIKSNKLEDKVFVHQMALNHAVMDYFSDIQRLKDYQGITHINDVKIKAYETFWLLKRRPLQLKEQLEDDKWLHVNEKFLLARLAAFMLREDINMPLTKQKKESFTKYLDTLYYYLKFRKTDAQAIELMLMAFEAGMEVSKKNI